MHKVHKPIYIYQYIFIKLKLKKMQLRFKKKNSLLFNWENRILESSNSTENSENV